MKTIALFVLLAGSLVPAMSPAAPADGVYIIFDGSGSMWGQLPDGVHKIQAARKVLTDFVATDFGDREIALRVYGHRRKGDCSDTELVQGFSNEADAIARMQSFVARVNPTGKTPISRSLRAALADFGDREGEIILISDGIETCGEDPCALVREWAEKNIAIKVHVVGLGLDEKEQAAMQCIADAAGTEYQDAQTSEELAAGLGKIREQVQSAEFKLTATGTDGEPAKVKGFLTPQGGDPVPVSSHARYVFEAGEYELTAGVETRNGNLYKPVTREVTVKATGTTRVDIVVEVPPRVSVKFFDQGEEVRPTGQVRAYQGASEVLRFRAIDEAFVDEGEYEFRVEPNAFNKLTQRASLAAGDRKILEYNLARSVHVKITFVASGSEMIYRRHNPELWQDGEKQFTLNASSGRRVRPGTYDVVFPSPLTGHTVKDVVISDESRQEYVFTIPSGHVTFAYENADGTPGEDRRLFVSRVGVRGSKTYKESGDKIALTPGDYYVEGWRPPDGTKFEQVDFSVAEGDDKVVTVRAIPNL